MLRPVMIYLFELIHGKHTAILFSENYPYLLGVFTASKSWHRMQIHTSRSSGKDDNANSTASQKKGPTAIAQMPAVPALQAATAQPLQKKENETEDLQPAPFIPVQTKERAPLQLQSRQSDAIPGAFKPIQRKENKTGLPDNLKSGVESLSGTNLSDVKVHYGSSQPAQFNAYAYAQGTDIHIAPGQEQHLPHEAWHVAQQKQGRVQATTQMKGAGINDDVSLEKEADDMGVKAMSLPADSLASGYEHFNKSDISDVRGRASLASTTQRQSFDAINSEITSSIKTINSTGNTSVQRQQVTQLVAGKFIVDDGGELKEGQMHKASFLSSLRTEVQKVAKEILEPVGLAQNDCPDLNYWIGFYQAKDVAYFEAAIARYAPATAAATNSDEYLAHLAERVKDGLVDHVTTGGNRFDPEPAPADVEAKRPDPAVLNIQKKEIAPMQFGCAGSITADRPSKAQTVFTDITAIAALGTNKEKAKALWNYYSYAQNEEVKDVGIPMLTATWADIDQPDHDDANAMLRTGPSKVLAILSSCGGSQMMVMKKLFGVGHDEKMQTFDRGATDVLSKKTRATAAPLLSVANKVICFAAADGKGGHCFTIATENSRDIKGQVKYFLFQGWVGRQNVFQAPFTRTFTQAEFDTFLTDITTNTNHGYFAASTEGFAYVYMIFDLPQ
jgi:hypothetical protein